MTARSVLQGAWQFLSSMQLAIVTLLLLGIVTFVGTEAQGRGMPLFEVQKHYFESFWFKEHLFGPIHIILPGGLSLMVLLTLNLFVGGFARMRKDWRRAGILLTHGGVALLIIASGIKMWVAEEGAVRLVEKERGDVFQSYHYWDLTVQEELSSVEGESQFRQWTVPSTELGSATVENELTLRAPDWPFELRLSRFAENAELLDGRRVGGRLSAPVVDGYLLRPIANDSKEHSRNQPGVYFEMVPDTGEPMTNFLWAVSDPFGDRPSGVALDLSGRKFRLALRKRVWKLPFELGLDDFTVEFHPNSGRPRLFESVVDVYDENGRESAPIRMNEPLHKDEFVIYQESYGALNANPGPDDYYSQFAVSRNPVDTLPWWSCGVIALGMLWHFGAMLRRYLLKMSVDDRSKFSRGFLRTILRAGGAVLLGLGLSMPANGQELPREGSDLPRVEPLPIAVRTWDYGEEFLETARRWPLQFGGRVMPLDTFARTFLMRINNRTTHELQEGAEGEALFGRLAGTKLSASEWLLDFMFFPEQAEDYRCIEVTDRDVFVLFGIQEIERRKRDRHSLREFKPFFRKMFSEVQRMADIPEDSRSRLQKQGLTLWQDLVALYSLRSVFEPLRNPVPLVSQDDGSGQLTASESFDRLIYLLEIQEAAGAPIDQQTSGAIRQVLKDGAGQDATWFWIPPSRTEQEAWYHLPDLVKAVGEPGVDRLQEVELVRSVALVVAAAPQGQVEFETAALAFVRGAQEGAEKRGEFGKISQEVSFTDRDWFFRALVTFLIGFHVVLLSWAMPRSKWIGRIAGAIVTLGAVLVVGGVTERCLLRERPPISTLYETILFITGTAVVICLVSEWIQRNRVSLTVGALLGAAGMFAARRFEVFSAEDTMPQLQAVLDSNFWLAIHVTTINLGYMAMLVAGVLGHAYLFTKIFGGVRRLRGGEDVRYSRYRDIGRVMYGALALGVITSTVGTILGGVWAADSWGRFWGWDPKENGALLIVICGLVILHSRIAGLVRDFGIAVLTSLSNIVVLYSWFGVNLMGVGLHSYGFQAGLKQVIETGYYFELFVALGGGLAAFLLHNAADNRTRGESKEGAADQAGGEEGLATE
ncbi:MAG: cytochrome c biogenesis protein CcsA [Planctomycetota bacterium]